MMDRKKKIAIILGAVWVVIILVVINLPVNKGAKNITLEQPQKQTQQQVSKNIQPGAASYPQLMLTQTRKDLFSMLVNTAAEKKEAAERKKIVNLPAPPLPSLPEEQKEVKQEEVDTLKNIMLIGIFDRQDRKTAFFRKDREIKGFEPGQTIFDTAYVVERVEYNGVVIKSRSGERKTMEITKEPKEGKNEKK